MYYEFRCQDCGGIHADYFPVDERPPIGSILKDKKCSCGGNVIRIISTPTLNPEFFGYTMENVGEQPVHFGTKTAIEKFRRDEFIKSTDGTKLAGKDGKLEYADRYFKQDLVKKQKDREVKRAKALDDAYVKAEFRAKKEEK